MPRPRGVRAGVETLTLSDGDSITIKRELTSGESSDVSGLSIRGFRQGEDGRQVVEPDMVKAGYLKAATYLVAWSFFDINTGMPWRWPVEASLDTKIEELRKLDQATRAEINAAIEAHEKKFTAPVSVDPLSNGSSSAGTDSSS